MNNMADGFCLALGLFALIKSKIYYTKVFYNDLTTLIPPIVLDFLGTLLIIGSVVDYYINR